MKHVIVHYPTISIPSIEWVRQAILYWDQIGVVAPISDSRHRYAIPALMHINTDGCAPESLLAKHVQDMCFLRDEGILNEYDSADITRSGSPRATQIAEEFLSLYTSEQADCQARIPEQKRVAFSVREGVVPDRVVAFLEERGLAFRNKDGVLSIDYHPFSVYDSLTAKYVVPGEGQYCFPGTDWIGNERLLYGRSQSPGGISAVSITFQNLLPHPRQDVAIYDLLEFKHRRNDELLAFREFLNQLHGALMQATSIEELVSCINSYQIQFERGVQNLCELMDDHNLAVCFGSAKTLTRISSPALLTVFSAVNSSTHILGVPIEVTLGAAFLCGAIQIASYVVDQRNKIRENLRNSPFAYIYNAKNERLVR